MKVFKSVRKVKCQVSGVLIAALILAPIWVFADLTITIQPGYQYSSTERPTATTLNQLGRPTAQVTGTLGGTNVSLGAATVSGTMLMDSVAGSNLTYNTASPRGLVVAPDGIYPLHLHANVAGNGLAGGGGTALSVNVGGSNLVIISDTVRVVVPSGKIIGGDANGLGTNINVGAGLQVTGGTLSLSNTTFTSFEYSLSASFAVNTNHSLGAAPVMLRTVLVCKTNDGGFQVGWELDPSALWNNGNQRHVMSYGANATNVWAYGDDSLNYAAIDPADGSVLTLNEARWRLKIYAKREL